jgi:hypothetical protein
MTVPKQNMNLRAGPGTDYALAGAAKAGQPLEIVGRNQAGTWWQVCCTAGKPAWLSAALATVQGDAAGVPVPASIPPPPPKPTAKPGPDLTPLARDKTQQLMTKAMDAVDGVSMVMPMALPLPGLEGALLFTYHTESSREGQTQEFMTQLRQAVFAAVPAFVRADPPWETLVVWPLPPDGANMVKIPRQSALDWYTGKLDNAAFENTWKTQ